MQVVVLVLSILSTEVETAAVDTEEEVIESGEDSSKQVVSLLDRLKSPRPATH